MADFDCRELGKNFGLLGEFVDATRYGSGHINDTFRAVYDQAGIKTQYIHQRLNNTVFKDPAKLMSNISTVTSHQHDGNRNLGRLDCNRRALTLVPTCEGVDYFVDPAGNFWRTYLFIEGARTYDKVESSAQAWNAASAFAKFQLQLIDLPPNELNVTIADFHNTSVRYQQCLSAIEEDPMDRLQLCEDDVSYVIQNAGLATLIEQLQVAGDIPERVVHNDTKLNNVMIDDNTGEGICVIDLDTVMPGTLLSDFGDMVRTATMPVAEDEIDLSLVRMDFQMFEAIANGYIDTARGFLMSSETEHLAEAAQVITFEVGLRFLADFLLGDVYFKTHRDNHNLDRCRTQFALAADIGSQISRMKSLVSEVSRRRSGNLK